MSISRPLPLAELLAERPLTMPNGETDRVSMATVAGHILVCGIQHNSRRVEAGDLFVAIVGEHHDGRDHAAQAAARGAVAVLGPEPAPRGLNVPYIVANDPRWLLGPLAGRVYDHPDRRLMTVGVTGTNGKSSVISMLATVLAETAVPTATLGTLGYRFADREYGRGIGRTTPEASDLLRMMATMHDDGAAAAALEVSSHALSQGRVEGVVFDVAMFTNLSRDHLDFHGDMDSYFDAKRQLFDQLKDDGKSVVYTGDPWGRKLAASLPAAVTYSHDQGDIHVLDAELDLSGLRARLATPRGDLEITAPVIGRFNLENLMATVAAAEALALDRQQLTDGLGRLRPIHGRLDPVDAGQSFPVLVDYAHTPDALESALRSLRELGDRFIVAVFGCGGDRDRGKRPQMGRIAGELSDVPVLTSDNPRTENPAAIIAEVAVGVRASGNAEACIEVDRRQAIRWAIRHAAERQAQGESWLVLVSGKGHETGQDVGDRVIPFDDRDEVIDAIRTLNLPEVAHGRA